MGLDGVCSSVPAKSCICLVLMAVLNRKGALFVVSVVRQAVHRYMYEVPRYSTQPSAKAHCKGRALPKKALVNKRFGWRG
jgi:hypothetical protein